MPENTKAPRQARVGVVAASIGAGALVVVALITGVFSLLSKGQSFEVGVYGVRIAHSVEELNRLITDRWKRIDDFLGVLVSSSVLDAVEKGKLLGFRERVRGKHDLHAAALRDGNLVLAHERLRDLRSALNEVDDEIASLHKKYPDIGLTIREEQNQFWQRGVKVEIAYQKKEESFFRRFLRGFDLFDKKRE